MKTEGALGWFKGSYIDRADVVPRRLDTIEALNDPGSTLMELLRVAVIEERIPFVDGSLIRPAKHVENGVWIEVHEGGRVIDRMYWWKVEEDGEGEWRFVVRKQGEVRHWRGSEK